MDVRETQAEQPTQLVCSGDSSAAGLLQQCPRRIVMCSVKADLDFDAEWRGDTAVDFEDRSDVRLFQLL